MASVVRIVVLFCLLLAAVLYVTANVPDETESDNEISQGVSSYRRHMRLTVVGGRRGGGRWRPGRPGRWRRPEGRGQGRGRSRCQSRRRDRWGSAAVNITSLPPRARRLINALSTSQNIFTSNLHGEVGRPETDVVYSPYSIHQALTMTYMGARTQTAFQMKRALSLQGLGRRAHRANMRLNMLMNSPGNATLETANGVYVKAGVSLLSEFSDGLRTFYQSNITLFDWNHPDGPEGPINEWVSAQTHTLIPTILNPGTITQMTAMVLVNAIYFKAKWKTQFQQERTTQQMFSKTATEQVPVQMMRIEDQFKMGVVPGHSARVLELPYQGDRFSMLIILPDQRAGLSTLEESLTADILAITLDTTMPTRVNVFLPRFKLETFKSLKVSLQNMGMVRAFDADTADFSGINGGGNLYISKVIHKAVVDVNEEGSEAAGATAAVVAIRASVPENVPEFRCDHPFLFIIRDNASKVNLFVGKFSGGS